MEKPTLNELALRVISQNGIRKEYLMEEYGLNRFEAHAILNELVQKGILEFNRGLPIKKDSMWLPATVTKEMCDYLGIDISKIDFTTENLKNLVDTEMDARRPSSGLGITAYYNVMLFPVDENKTRMLCGDLKTGDRVCYYTKENIEHPIYGWQRTDTLGYELCYNGKRTMSQVENGTKYEWEIDESQNGWGIGQMWQDVVNVYTRNNTDQYLPMPEALLGKPLVNMDFAFAERNINTVIDTIPDTVKSIRGLCYNSYITKTPKLPDGIENAELAFAKCPRLEKITNIPSTIKPELSTDMLYKCPRLTEEELDKLPPQLRTKTTVRECGEGIVSDKDVLSDKPAKIGEEENKIDKQDKQISDDISL